MAGIERAEIIGRVEGSSADFWCFTRLELLGIDGCCWGLHENQLRRYALKNGNWAGNLTSKQINQYKNFFINKLNWKLYV